MTRDDIHLELTWTLPLATPSIITFVLSGLPSALQLLVTGTKMLENVRFRGFPISTQEQIKP